MKDIMLVALFWLSWWVMRGISKGNYKFLRPVFTAVFALSAAITFIASFIELLFRSWAPLFR